MTTFKGMGDFAKRSPEMLDKAIRTVGRVAQREAIKAAADRMDSLNPPRSSRDHQHFVDSWFYAVDGRNVGTGLPRVEVGHLISRANSAAHARVLDQGLTVTGKGIRQLPSKGKGGRTVPAGRRIGTPSAPRGYSRPAMLHLRARKEAIIQQAIAAANRKL